MLNSTNSHMFCSKILVWLAIPPDDIWRNPLKGEHHAIRVRISNKKGRLTSCSSDKCARGNASQDKYIGIGVLQLKSECLRVGGFGIFSEDELPPYIYCRIFYCNQRRNLPACSHHIRHRSFSQVHQDIEEIFLRGSMLYQWNIWGRNRCFRPLGRNLPKFAWGISDSLTGDRENI